MGSHFCRGSDTTAVEVTPFLLFFFNFLFVVTKPRVDGCTQVLTPYERAPLNLSKVKGVDKFADAISSTCLIYIYPPQPYGARESPRGVPRNCTSQQCLQRYLFSAL